MMSVFLLLSRGKSSMVQLRVYATIICIQLIIMLRLSFVYGALQVDKKHIYVPNYYTKCILL